MVDRSLPTMLFEDDNMIVKFDFGGLVIVRKNAKDGEYGAITLTPEEAVSFTSMYAMGNSALQSFALNAFGRPSQQGMVMGFMPNPFDKDEDDD